MPKTSPEHLAMRREQILNAAMLCFARDGFHAASMAQVIGASKMSAGSVYRYFPNKRALIHASAAAAMSTIREAFASATKELADVDEPLPTIGYLAATVANTVSEKLGPDSSAVAGMAIAIWAESARDEELRKVLAEGYSAVRDEIVAALKRRQSAGTIREGIDVEALGQALFALMPGLVVQHSIMRDVDARGATAALASAIRVSVDD